MRIIVFIILMVALLGCERQVPVNPKATKITHMNYRPDIVYFIVEIEGKKWIATPGSHGEWSLAGPIE